MCIDMCVCVICCVRETPLLQNKRNMVCRLPSSFHILQKTGKLPGENSQ